MNSKKSFPIISFFLTIVIFSCSSSKDEGSQDQYSPKQVREELVKMNQFQHAEEEDMIEAYIKRRSWLVERSGTGLRYVREDSVENRVFADEKDRVTYAYVCTKLNGDTLYNSATDGLGKTVIAYDRTIPGLHEALQTIALGEKATIIIPSHLAHGLHGDDKKVGPWETLVYQVEIIDIVKNDE